MTPSGVLVVRPVPSTSTGPSVREMVLGSEGRLGIITEATIQVRRVPPERTILGYLFPTWADGLAAMRDIAASEASPSVTRVSDPYETAFSFATRTDPTPVDRLKSKALRAFLKRKGWDLEAMCLAFIGYEGSAAGAAAERKATERIAKRHGALCIGSSPGELYDQKKFDTPYIRDFLLDRGAPADVSETSAPWGELQTVYDNVMAAGHGAFTELGVPGYLMCHLSHSYHAGACLYFTFAINPPADGDALEMYGVVKRAIQQAFVDSGATLSTSTRSARSTPSGSRRTSRAPGWRCCRRSSRASTPGGTSTRARSSQGARRAPAPTLAEPSLQLSSAGLPSVEPRPVPEPLAGGRRGRAFRPAPLSLSESRRRSCRAPWSSPACPPRRSPSRCRRRT